MIKYEYKVDYLNAQISTQDVDKGLGGSKVANQVEIKLREYSDKGFEFYSQNIVSVDVKPGCIGAILSIFGIGRGASTLEIMVLTFRKEI